MIDPKLSKDVTTITLSYTFFEVGGRVPAPPADIAADDSNNGNNGNNSSKPAAGARS